MADVNYEISKAGRSIFMSTLLPGSALLGIFLGWLPAVLIGSIDYWFVCGLVIALGLPFWVSASTTKRMRYLHAALSKALKKGAKKLDYYNALITTAIGVDVENREIVFVALDGKKKSVTDPVTIKLDRVISYKAFEPQANLLETFGMGMTALAASHQVSNRNRLESAKAAMRTGLYIECDDLDHPTLMANMEFEDAERWVRLLDRFRNGQLDAQENPKIFPA